ncbi:MAG: ABC transporter substrate-binding protein [Terracidiphilus sp.]
MRRRSRIFLPIFAVFLSALPGPVNANAQPGSQLRFSIGSDPKTLNPLMVDDDSSDTVRYLTGGVLVRMNRLTQQLEPELATSWKVSANGKSIRFTLRPNLYFSDGTPFTAADVAYTVRKLMDPSLHSPVGDAFRAGGAKAVTEVTGKYRISITFPAPIVGLDKLFDELAIMSQKSPLKEKAVLGPYYLAEDQPGSFLLLERNPNYWKRDAAGRRLPYIDSIRLDIEENRDIEMLRLLRGQIDFINSLSAEYYVKLKAQAPKMAYDAGVSLDAEQMWFNEVPNAPLPAYKKAWFASTDFRRAVSEAIDRADLARIAFRGYAQPAVSWISPANKFWFNAALKPYPFDPRAALDLLRRDGFTERNGALYDRGDNAVEFSLVTNAGNKTRELMAAMIQQDLAGIGIRLNVVTLDFPSLIERMTRTFNYEACLLGLVNNDLDPDTQMNVWLSSGENHIWNPDQKTPATPWEAQIDALMREQASDLDIRKRKLAVDKVQSIVWQQEPFIYLVNPDSLSAVSPALLNAHPVVLRPQVFWNIDQLMLARPGTR